MDQSTLTKARNINPEDWQPVDRAVLCFIRNRQSGRVLMIHKKTGLGKGLINGPGGRIEQGETPREAAVREIREEVCVNIKADRLRHGGDLFFQFKDGYSIRGYVFDTEEWEGTPRATEEADPFWCPEDDIPYNKMWKDDAWWMPQLLARKQFRGRFIFDGETMLSMSLDIEFAE